MKRTIAFILTLVMVILCCAAVQAETEKVMVNGNDIEIYLVRVDLLDYGSPSLNLVMRGVNNTDRKLYIRFADPVIDGVELYGYSQGLEPHEEADLGCLIFSDEGDTKAYNVIRNGKKLTLEVKISDSDTGDKILTETVSIDLPRKEKEEEKKTVNIPVYDTSKDSAGGPSSGGSSSSGSYHDVSPGKTITFGHYDQDGNVSNGVEPIDWLVLDVSGSKAFVVCNCGLFNAKYTEHSKQQVWENCDLRATLNSSFLYEAFSQAERDAIQLTYVDNSGPGRSVCRVLPRVRQRHVRLSLSSELRRAGAVSAHAERPGGPDLQEVQGQGPRQPGVCPGNADLQLLAAAPGVQEQCRRRDLERNDRIGLHELPELHGAAVLLGGREHAGILRQDAGKFTKR